MDEITEEGFEDLLNPKEVKEKKKVTKNIVMKDNLNGRGTHWKIT